ncbi:Nramp family divalent metal transporter [Pseudonocardia sp.]|jgi:manganese transport protein|uniref:Nramp family divalent metal transporter n=1 Tax=Pseudonocardia sp. TaxID=60912 RepID=UPI00263531B6|nr:Nramp family divalent metal transporter [Pseudonocardia sp.]MCW2718606.1 manganese transport protein MntH [Pseudonocardia sp.]MDT7614356.1 manganese transport protein [Pseudonocardiales bacterium]
MTTTGDRPQTITEIRERGGWRSRLIFFGPAFVAAIAYVDPGNFATNFSAGAQFGYLLLWVIVAANLLAMLIQTLSAKLGMATGRNLPEMCREQFPRPVTRLMWVQAELVAVATDLAEVIGGAIALNLLFGIPLFTGGVITGLVAFALLALQNKGFRPFELAIAGLFCVILLGFLTTAFRIDVGGADLAAGLVPRFDGTDSLLLATGILGATVMPHVIYLHSALTQGRIPAVGVEERKFLLRRQQTDVLVGMGLAGVVNGAMLVIAAALFFGTGIPDTDTLEGVHAGLARALDQPAALAFALALLASGFASSGVGTYAGQVVMQGFIRRSIPLLARRLLTLVPALIVLGVGFDPTRALVLSQVVLSFGIPFALVPLVLLTRRSDIMAELVNRRSTTILASLAAATIIGLNAFLIVRAVTGA